MACSWLQYDLGKFWLLRSSEYKMIQCIQLFQISNSRNKYLLTLEYMYLQIRCRFCFNPFQDTVLHRFELIFRLFPVNTVFSLIYIQNLKTKTNQVLNRCRQVFKSGGASNNVVDIICPSGWNRVNKTSKFWGLAPPEVKKMSSLSTRSCIRHISTLPVYLIFKNIVLYPLIRASSFIKHLSKSTMID